MLKSFLLKKMLASQMKDVPEEMRNQIAELVEKNPDLFMKIAEEVKREIDAGKDEMGAAIEVLKRHESELRAVVGK